MNFTKTNSAVALITCIGDLAHIGDSRKLLLAGEVIFGSLEKKIPDGFEAQNSRDADSNILAQLGKDATKLHVAVDARLFKALKIRVALSIDGYLKWGLRQRNKNHTILFGGAETDNGVNVEVMVFLKGKLIDFREKSLPGKDTIYFQNSLNAMLEELKMAYPSARMVQASPLSDWSIPGVAFIGETPLKFLSYRPLAQNVNSKINYLIPVILLVSAFAGYPTLLIAGWNKYANAVSDYELAIADPAINSKDGMDTDFLNKMNTRRIYMDQLRRQTLLADKSLQIVTGIASIKDVHIVEMKLPAPGGTASSQIGLVVDPESRNKRASLNTERSADVWVSIAMKKSSEVALVQAKDIMTQIANATGLSLRLTHQGWRDDGDRRILNIEGFIHD